MHELTLTNRDVLMISYALRILLAASYCVRDSYDPEDFENLKSLSKDFDKLAQADAKERNTTDATSTNRC